MNIYKETIPYTYLVGWRKYNKWYYGVRFAKNCHPSDLWIKYHTSSKTLKKFREEFGEPDVIEVRKIFDDIDAARLWESKVLKRMKVVSDDKWINKTDNKSIDLNSCILGARKKKSNTMKEKLRLHHKLYGGPNKGKKISEETKKKMSDSRKGLTYCTNGISERKIKKFYVLEFGWKYGRLPGRTKDMTGFKHSEETKKKMSESRKGKIPSNKGIKFEDFYGIERSKEIKRKISENRKTG